MQNAINTPTSYRMPSERLNTSSYAVDTIKSFDEQYEYDQILEDLANLETPQRVSSKRPKNILEPPSSNSKNNQIAPKEPMEYIFAENHSSIYYTENLDEDRSSQFESGSKKFQPNDEIKVKIKIEDDKNLLSTSKIEQQSRNYSTKSSRINDRVQEMDAFEDRSMCILEKDSLSNGIIIDPVRVHEEKPFIVVSVLNDISNHKKSDQELSSHVNTTITSMASASKKGEDSIIFMKCQEELKQSEMQINGLRNLKNQVSDFMNSLNQQRTGINNRAKENEKVVIEPSPAKTEKVLQEIREVPVEQIKCRADLFKKQDQVSVGSTAEDIVYIQKKEELNRSNKQLLEEEEEANTENASEGGQYHPLMKKTLSVIFSTDESIETNSYRDSRKILGSGSFNKESNPFFHSQGRTTDTLKNKENIAVPEEKEGFMTMTASSAGTEDENFLSLAQMMKYQNKDNKELIGKLNKLIDLYNKQIEKYEVNNSHLIEKNKKYSKGNDLLIKTLKAFEKEMDKLVSNNQTLHKNIIFLQDEIKGYETKQNALKELVIQQESVMSKLKEELKSKFTETEDFKCKLELSNVKIENLTMTVQSCEDAIFKVSQILKETLTQKKSKITSKSLYTTFEAIYSEIANFADNLNSTHKLRDSRNTSMLSRKSNESIFSHESELLPAKRENFRSNITGHRMTKDLKPTKHISKSIDLTSSMKASTYQGLLSHRNVTNRHRQHSLVESTILDHENTYAGLSARGRSRQTSLERTKSRLDRSAPIRDSQSNKNAVRMNRYALEADVEENLRKMLISNLRTRNPKYT